MEMNSGEDGRLGMLGRKTCTLGGVTHSSILWDDTGMCTFFYTVFFFPYSIKLHYLLFLNIYLDWTSHV